MIDSDVYVLYSAVSDLLGAIGVVFSSVGIGAYVSVLLLAVGIKFFKSSSP